MQSLKHLGRFLSSRVAVRTGVLLALVATTFFALHPVAFAAECGADVGCMFWNAFGNAAAGVIASILLVVVQAFNVILGWTGMFFNWVILVTVFRFSDYFGNSAGVLLAWGILRDLANIGLLFSFVYIGIQNILGVKKYEAKKTIPRLIMFAALLNFSLFAGEAIIDVSNALGSAIYTQATNIDCSASGQASTCQDQGIAAVVFQTTGIASMLHTNGDAGTWEQLSRNGVSSIVLAFALLVFVITMIGVLFAAALMLISRAITLLYLMITSPIGLAGAVIPGLNDFSTDWWKKLMNNVAFAPVFVLLVLIGLKIVDGVRHSFIGDENASIIRLLSTPGVDVGGIFLFFAITVGFMITALQTANRFSLYGSKAVVDRAMKFIGNTAGGMVLYPAGAIASGANKMYNAGVRGFRRSNPVTSRLVGLAGGAAIDRSIRGGLSDITKLKPIPGMDSYSEMNQQRKSRIDELEKGDKSVKQNREKEASSARNQADLADAFKQAHAGNSDKLETSLKKMSAGDIKAALAKGSDKDKKAAAVAMSATKFKQVMEGDELDAKAKKTLREERYAPLREQIRNGNGGEIRKWHVDDLVSSGVLDDAATRASVVKHVSDQQFDAIAAHNEYGSNAIDKFKRLRNGTETGGRFGDSVSAQDTLAGMSPARVAKLPGPTLTSTNVLPNLKPEHFKEIMTSNELVGANKNVVVNHVQAIYARPVGDPQKDALDTYLGNLRGNGALRSQFRTYYGI